MMPDAPQTTTEQPPTEPEPSTDTQKKEEIARKSPWNSLEIAKLLASLVTPIAVVFIGYLISAATKEADNRHTQQIRESEAQRAQQLRDAEAIRGRRTAVVELSKFIYERRVRAELLSSAMRRNATNPVDESRQEVIARKRDYDIAYANWNTNSQAILLRVRTILLSPTYSGSENVIETRLVGRFLAPLDRCLTEAFDVTIRNGDPRPILQKCKSTTLVQNVLDCGYAITNELYRLSSELDPKVISQDHVARHAIDDACLRADP